MARKKKQKASPILLSEELALQFQVVNWKGGRRKSFGRFGIVDLDSLTIKQANRLVDRGFPYIERKEKVIKD